jgi:hypothetical protein
MPIFKGGFMKRFYMLLTILFSISLFSQTISESDVARKFYKSEPIFIVKGDITNSAAFYADGENTNVGTALEDVNNSNASLNYTTVSHRVKVNSTSTSDATAGVGIRTVTITGLDADWNPVTAVLILAANGTDSVTSATTIKFFRVFKIEATTTGATGFAVGTIKLVTKESDTLLAQIDIGYNQSFQSRFTVPVGYYGYVKSIYAMSNVASKANTIYLYAKEFGEPWKRIFPMQINASSFNYEFTMPFEFPEKTDIEIRALSAGGSGSIAAGFSGYYSP